MRCTRVIGHWLLPALFFGLILTVACSGEHERPSTVTREKTNTPEMTPASFDARTPDRATRRTASATAASVALQPTPSSIPTSTDVPTPTVTQTHAQAKRSDFIVALPGAINTPSPSLTATVTLTPRVLAASVLTRSMEHEIDRYSECTHDAQFVSDLTTPDGTVTEPGGAFVKMWRLRNIGTCDWDNAFSLRFAQGDRMDSPTSVAISPTHVGDTVDVSVLLSAPEVAGTYTGHWQLEAPDGQIFGDSVFAQIVVEPSPASAPTPEPQPRPDTHQVPPLVLLNYFAWYDGGGWEDCNISAGDRPLQPYHSDDVAAIAGHVRMALDAGADGFTQQWFVPGGRTDRNFDTLLAQSSGTDFNSTVIFLRHIWPGSPAPNQANVSEAIRYLLDRYSHHPNFLKLEGKPVLFFTDVYRVPTAPGQTPQQAWAGIRAEVDPAGNAWWIAEGLDPSFLSVFDGLWVYKITHASSPQAYLKAIQWADSVRQWEARTGKRKLWVATLSPGWDDTRASCKADVRVPSAAHQQPRGDGAFFRATFDAALASQPDWLWVNSFNEWVEGTYVEPSVYYGDFYLQLTRDFARQFKSQ